MPLLVVVMGGLLTLWWALSLLLAVLADAALAALILQLYRSGGGTPSVVLPSGSPAFAGLTLSTGRLVAAAVMAAGVAAIVGFLFMEGLRAEDNALIIAHRGASIAAPENTLAAVALAIQEGADYVEFDVQESRDGRVVVAHDADLMRVGRTPLSIWSTDSARLREVDIGSFHSSEFAAERVPFLEEVLELGRDRVRLLIELKYYGHEVRLEERVVEIVERLGMQDQISVMSLKPQAVTRMKQLRPDWNVGLLTAVAVGNLTRMPADFLAVNSGMATPAFIDRAHAAGKPVWVWTVNDPINMSRFLSRGVDGLITDLPGRGREVLAERAELNSGERLLLAAAFWVGLDPPVEPAVAVDVPAGSIAE